VTTPLPESYLYCQSLARRAGRNFYFSFLTLPRAMFRDMCVLYAFMRHTDDLVDDPGTSIDERRCRLEEWRGQLNSALNGGPACGRILPALADVVTRHRVPDEHLREVISGVESDLTPRQFETFDDLAHYCYQVAGAVGLCCIHVWSFDDERASACAVHCGLALQLTNILRDLGEDARLGRIYLPRSDLRQFGYTESDLQRHVRNDAFRALMRFEIARARQYYERGTELHDYLPRPGRRILSAMLRIYGGLLDEIERRDYDVFSRRAQLSTVRKLAITVRSLFG
jgi:phytoene synthase